ncbi:MULTISPECIES: aspartyl/asparaginyl beta-hydroxylase domain-containing protein [Streptomyces]|uniref:Aspartyl/asparaginyl beta-hydroxylase domain-containing protein n=1 Tax=Streptomyces griseiscabiei TaxID=2993540 RepID=A0ABU4KY38_9ACTN|nr:MULTISPECIES: aspartyl/asparaginyl beta-hydroxylase domain-containing protein [Streptomyces]MBZ3904626.1 aspartyl/asparaginyl beta-hydroxylase domain-containing protein [Streptomyces griseiscabiei]MDX2908375.1 aspartyl/asparaginyl beta-hydroxylase domain-containing protein [Streptomyces griseiscabiei]
MTRTRDGIDDLPEAAVLRRSFDPEPLRRDLDILDERAWGAQRTVVDGGELTDEAEIDWRCLPLRSPAGDPARTDPGGPGTDGFADTPLLARAPHLAEVLDSLPTPLRCARLMSLAPGVEVPEHRDTPTGLLYGFVRLHVPIRTNPGAVLRIDGKEHRWRPGSLWYGDFGRPHSVVNTGDRARVHLVVDCAVTPALLDLFPEDFQRRVPLSDVAFARPEVPLRTFELTDFQCALTLPPSFLRLDEPVAEHAEPDLDARIVAEDGRLVLDLADGPRFGLVHVGGGEFLLQGWIEERGLYLGLAGDHPRVVLFSRRGRHRQSVERPARPAALA